MSTIALNYNRNDNYIILYELIILFNTDKSRTDQNRLKFAICSSNCINSCDIVSKSSDLGVRSVYLDSKVLRRDCNNKSVTLNSYTKFKGYLNPT